MKHKYLPRLNLVQINFMLRIAHNKTKVATASTKAIRDAAKELNQMKLIVSAGSNKWKLAKDIVTDDITNLERLALREV